MTDTASKLRELAAAFTAAADALERAPKAQRQRDRPTTGPRVCEDCAGPLPGDAPNWKTLCRACFTERKRAERQRLDEAAPGGSLDDDEPPF